jgi:hypothetical protein
MDAPPYKLPLRVEVVRGTTNGEGHVTVEILLVNTGREAFEVPISRNLSEVIHNGNKLQKEFSFGIQSLGGKSFDRQVVAVTAGSASIPSSLLRLSPGSGVRIVLPVQSATIRQALRRGEEKLTARIDCEEEKFAEDRFFIEASSTQLASENAITFGFRGDKPFVTLE